MPPRVSPNAVFLNTPYDNRYRRLYLAYIVGLSYLGADYNQFRHLVQCYAATPCNVMPPSI